MVDTDVLYSKQHKGQLCHIAFWTDEVCQRKYTLGEYLTSQQKKIIIELVNSILDCTSS